MPRRNPSARYVRSPQRPKPSPRGDRRVCITGKTRYGDRDEALRVLRAIQRTSTRERVPQRVHDEVCDFCGGWHLTSLSAEVPRESRH